MSLPVSLREIVFELDGLTDTSELYLDKRTGKAVFVDDELRDLGEMTDKELAKAPEWQQNECLLQREIETTDHFIPLPSKFDLDDFRTMRDFCRSYPDANVRTELIDAIAGRGAFRRFRAVVSRHEIWKAWEAHQTAARAEIAADWLKQHGIPYVNDLPELGKLEAEEGDPS